ncbi:hypothetical protein ACOCJ5_08625 [Knoellia sp. CPCC 206450]|uniref:hypothetical protein n=1 Tax=Knoellia tibetensis TaxID=3404798 RepID=UPI003B436ACF
MSPSRRTSVSSREFQELVVAVARANHLDGDGSAPAFQLLDPTCMLDALSEVYLAAMRLVNESRQRSDELLLEQS